MIEFLVSLLRKLIVVKLFNNLNIRNPIRAFPGMRDMVPATAIALQVNVNSLKLQDQQRSEFKQPMLLFSNYRVACSESCTNKLNGVRIHR